MLKNGQTYFKQSLCSQLSTVVFLVLILTMAPETKAQKKKQKHKINLTLS